MIWAQQSEFFFIEADPSFFSIVQSHFDHGVRHCWPRRRTWHGHPKGDTLAVQHLRASTVTPDTSLERAVLVARNLAVTLASGGFVVGFANNGLRTTYRTFPQRLENTALAS